MLRSAACWIVSYSLRLCGTVCCVVALFGIAQLWLSGRGAQAEEATSTTTEKPNTGEKPALTPAARPPFVAGFDRFFELPATQKAPAAAEEEEAETESPIAKVARMEPVEAGTLLLGELNCLACHAPGEAKVSADKAASLHNLTSRVQSKPAPLLGQVASRANPAFIRRFIRDPHATKPGTTMPGLLSGMDAATADATAEALTHYMASLAKVPWQPTGADFSSVARGEELFHKVGCVACHAPRRNMPPRVDPNFEEDEQPEPIDLQMHSVPLSLQLHEKYSIPALAEFLVDPLKIRAGGRMPKLNLTDDEAIDIASYLLKDTKASTGLQLSFYEGKFKKLPKFESLAPKFKADVTSFVLGDYAKSDHFAVTFDGLINIDREGEYTFYLASDDGSDLWIDGKRLIENDGIHAEQSKSGKVQLSRGEHAFRLAYFNSGEGAILSIEYEGPILPRQTLDGKAFLHRGSKPAASFEAFQINPDLAKKGSELFTTVGCASCHQLEPDTPLKVTSVAPALEKLRANQGCLQSRPASGRPDYRLSARQIEAISAALSAQQSNELPPPSEQSTIVSHMTTLNCYACHQRDERGGVIGERDPFFSANSPDLGDEGRLPPTLTGVGHKLRPEWLKEVLENAAVARPYMDARMPQFGAENLGPLAEQLIKADTWNETVPKVTDSAEAALEAGRVLVGKEGLSCIACHVFNRQNAMGIQAMDLTLMAQRLRPEWFHKYLLNPAELRPGTRMPQSFLDGKSAKADIMDGNADRQIHALWEYLSQGRKAKQPDGLIAPSMELVVGGEAIIYRNFIGNAGTRAIAVGYPEEVNLAYDANYMRPASIWHGRFMDASQHWSGRGQGFVGPLGEDVINLVGGIPMSVLESETTVWPDLWPRSVGYKFRGYRLDDQRRPTFTYEYRIRPAAPDKVPPASATPSQKASAVPALVNVSDYFAGKGPEGGRHLVRTLKFDCEQNPDKLYFRLAHGKIDRDAQGNYRLDDKLTLHLTTPKETAPLLRKIADHDELLVPLHFKDHKTEFQLEYRW